MISARAPGAADPYHQATAILNGLSASTLGSCDSKHYRLSYLVASYRDLIVGVEVRDLQPMEAFDKAAALRHNIEPATDTVWDHDNLALRADELFYATRAPIADKLDAMHHPTSTNCDPAALDVEANETVSPDFPLAAEGVLSAPVTVTVKVSVNADGKPIATTVKASSGIQVLDAAASAAASNSTFFPAVRGCVRVPSTYLFTVTYDPNP
ncbi:MAG TPA: TonB family protein [Candidatus Baltobacteraceae bacterium]|nr:TonB family protein [Candidatus Baltobacteraceae bacterium]